MMEKNEGNIWEKFYGKKICTEKLNIEGFRKPIVFDIYDGHAVCVNHRGHRFDMFYPQLKCIKDSKEIAEEIIKNVGGIECVDEINVLHVLMAYNTLYKDGVEIRVSED